MIEKPPGWQVEYYTDARGECDVLEYINDLQETEQAQVAMVLRLLAEFGLAVGMPYARALKGHKPLWELRPGANRVIYFAHTGRRFIMLYAFRKKAVPQNSLWNLTKRGLMAG
jgi:hypothetical protein